VILGKSFKDLFTFIDETLPIIDHIIGFQILNKQQPCEIHNYESD